MRRIPIRIRAYGWIILLAVLLQRIWKMWSRALVRACRTSALPYPLGNKRQGNLSCREKGLFRMRASSVFNPSARSYLLCRGQGWTKKYITLLRIEAAKNLLQHSKYSITDISAACGFHDHSSFCKVFKRYACDTPSLYRQLLEKNTVSAVM